MPFDTNARAKVAAQLPLQFVHIELTPLVDGYSVIMQATHLDEDELQFVGQDLACERVDTLDDVIALIRAHVRIARPAASEEAA